MSYFSFTSSEEDRFCDMMSGKILRLIINRCLDDQEDFTILEWVIETTGQVDIFYEIAAVRGSTEAIKFLLSRGDPIDSHGVIWHAVENGHLEIVKLLQEHGCPVSDSILLTAVKRGHFEIVKWLIQNGCSYFSDDLERYFTLWLDSLTA